MKIGKFVIDNKMALSGASFFGGKVFPIRIDADVPAPGCAMYTALSEMFDSVDLGHGIPLYEIGAKRKSNGEIEYVARKILDPDDKELNRSAKAADQFLKALDKIKAEG